MWTFITIIYICIGLYLFTYHFQLWHATKKLYFEKEYVKLKLKENVLYNFTEDLKRK